MTKGHSYERGEGVDYTFWARLELPSSQNLRHDDILDRLAKRALAPANPFMPIIGAIVGEGKSTKRSELLLGIDPSKTWGTPEVSELEILTDGISRDEKWPRQSEQLPAMRIPLGRRRQYKLENEVTDMKTVAGYMRRFGRQALSLTAADLFSIRYIPQPNKKEEEKVIVYPEPGVLVDVKGSQFDDTVLEDMLKIAAIMGQDRLVPSIIAHQRTQVYKESQKKSR